MKLCLVLSVCLAFLSGIDAQQQQTEDNRSNGQGCQPPFCFNFDHIFDPIGKKIGKFNAIVGFKTNKINKVIGFKNAVKNFIPVKLQFEIDALRSKQALVDAKIQAKSAAKAGLKSLDNIANGVGFQNRLS